ncbi:DMT family transporter [Marinobacterium arenosum]|uniref:DMT family transporter n=1 Tax=Marinobacterium arenosum TaxID=2862496 RepID=UPI001C956B62|nr:multidrug efflux SMR transporter [Marinobacterium arenosum]MBY4679159.1 multidrug efflux SMR transporter [Marinobacterium arenosum]
MGWIYLILAGLAEMGFVSLLKQTQGFSNPLATGGFLGCALLSFWLLTKATASIPVAVAYPVWVGLGAVGALLVGTLLHGEPMTPTKLLFSVLLIGSIVGLKQAA